MSRDFSGTTPDCLTIGNLSHLNITGTALTIHAFIRPDDAGGAGQFVLSKDATSDRAYVLGVGAGGIQALVGNGGTGQDFLQGTSTLTNGVRYSIGMVKDGTGADALRAYLNGVADGTLTSNIVIGTSAAIASIGSRAGASNFYNGLAAEVAIWDVALSAAEMAALGMGVNARYIRPLSLKGYWPLYGTGSPEPDYSGFGGHATISGSVPAGAVGFPTMPFIFGYLPGSRGGVFEPEPPTPSFSPVSFTPPVVKLPHGRKRVRLPGPAADFETGVVSEFTEAATIYVDVQPSGVDIKEMSDAATVYIDITNTGGECYGTFSGTMLGEGEATCRWRAGAYQTRWSGDAQERWVLAELSSEVGC